LSNILEFAVIHLITITDLYKANPEIQKEEILYNKVKKDFIFFMLEKISRIKFKI